MYIPDKTFVRQLKEVDRHLSVAWNPYRHRWCIYREVGVGKPIMVKVVQENGEFRPLDRRTINELNHGDLWKRRNKIVEEFEMQDDKKDAWKPAFEEECTEEAASWHRHYQNPKVGWTPSVEKH